MWLFWASSVRAMGIGSENGGLKEMPTWVLSASGLSRNIFKVSSRNRRTESVYRGVVTKKPFVTRGGFK